MLGESLVLIVDRLISLVKTHEENKKKIFEGMIEPLFKGAETAFDDYRKFLVFARRLLLSDQQLSKMDIDEVNAKRHEQLNLRLKLYALSRIYKTSTDQTIQLFCAVLPALFAPSGERFNEGTGDGLFEYNSAYTKDQLDLQTAEAVLNDPEPLETIKKQIFLIRTPSSTMVKIVDLFEISVREQKQIQPDMYRKCIAEQIDKELVNCETRWSHLCEIYGELQLRYTMPISALPRT